jgi:hypothetical protein
MGIHEIYVNQVIFEKSPSPRRADIIPAVAFDSSLIIQLPYHSRATF